MKSQKLINKLSTLQTKTHINKLKGIQIISLSMNKPKDIQWYSNELNGLDFNKDSLCKLPYNIDVKEISNILSDIIDINEEFILIIYTILPIYLLFKITNLVDFLTSYFEENNSRDITIFFSKEKKLIDIFLNEEDLEITVFNE